LHRGREGGGGGGGGEEEEGAYHKNRPISEVALCGSTKNQKAENRIGRGLL